MNSLRHNKIVFGVVFSMFVGIVGAAEISNRFSAQKETAPSSVPKVDGPGAFSMAQVLVEQEIKAVSSNKKIDWQQHEIVVRNQMARISDADMITLKSIAANPAKPAQDRHASVYLLSLAGKRGQVALREMGKVTMVASKAKGNRVPASVASRKRAPLKHKAMTLVKR